MDNDVNNMANPKLLNQILSEEPVTYPWAHQCLLRLQDSSFNWTHGLVNGAGYPTSGLVNATWGITIETCKKYCNSDKIPLIFAWDSFSFSFTSYLLPRLALCAQLPYETGDFLSNGMSFCLAVGSPTLVTYSLAITILNRYSVPRMFSKLRHKAHGHSVRRSLGEYANRVRTSMFLLQECQQVPFRASQERAWFSSLIVIPDNLHWWNRLEERLKSTRRGVTFSLVAQMLFAGIAYLFTVITSFTSDLGDSTTALQIASGRDLVGRYAPKRLFVTTLTQCQIPVIAGWVTVGTQHTHHSIEAALEADTALRAEEPQSQPRQIPEDSDRNIAADHPTRQRVGPSDRIDSIFGTERSSMQIDESSDGANPKQDMAQSTRILHMRYPNDREQLGLVVRAGLTPQPRGTQEVVGGFEVANPDNLELPTWFSANVAGDEQRKGPIYNYARIFTWWQLASQMESALSRAVSNISDGLAVPMNSATLETPPTLQEPAVPARAAAHHRWDEKIDAHENMFGDSACTASYCGLLDRPILAYPGWTQIPSAIYRRIIVASIIALFLQWGTTSASIVIAFLTPTVGLGCRSGSYLIYGTIGTLVWALLLASMLLSHQVMLMYQAEQIKDPDIDFRFASKQYRRTWTHATLCALAVSFRHLGKLLAFLNALWLMASSLMEFTGGYDNCWCTGNYVGLGQNGWIVLFKDAADLATKARLPWGGGLALTLFVCFVSYTFFFFGSVKTDDG